jgi:hypothetical protein
MGRSKELIEQERLEYIDALLNDIQEEQPNVITGGQMSFIESLLQYAVIDHDEADRILNSMYSYTYEEAEKLISRLQLNQINPILAGHNYSQTDILNHLNKTI